MWGCEPFPLASQEIAPQLPTLANYSGGGGQGDKISVLLPNAQPWCPPPTGHQTYLYSLSARPPCSLNHVLILPHNKWLPQGGL